MNPADLSITDAGGRLRNGSLSVRELTEAHLERIAARDATLNAFVVVDADAALQDAAAVDRDFAAGIDRGPLQGIPLAVKDLVDVAGQPTACGSRLREGAMASRDADVVRSLREAGALILGKVATYEFGLEGPSFDGPRPPAGNPWNPDRITGGSSSGAAAAVAGGLVRAAIATDTGGSVRSPAAYCGAVGLKPTFGRLSVGGVFPVSPSLDHVGLLAASVEEAEIVYTTAAGILAGDAMRGCDGLRLGYARGWFAEDPDLDPDVLEAADAAVSDLSLAGARIELMEVPDYHLAEAIGAVILHAEALNGHRATLASDGALYGRRAYQSLAAGACLTAEDLASARAAARHLRVELDSRVFDRFDALVTVTTLTPAPPVDAFQTGAPVWTPMRTLPFNVTGHPALSVPAGFVDGMPIGLQIVGRHGDERGICRIGRAFELATGHAAQRPPRADQPVPA